VSAKAKIKSFQVVQCLISTCIFVARLHNSYQAIEGGFTQDGMEDLTGGIVVMFDLGEKTPPDMLTILKR